MPEPKAEPKKVPMATEATLRDHFAAHALQKFAVPGEDPKPRCAAAYVYADEMLEARKTPEEVAAEKEAARVKAAQEVVAAAKPAAK
jgi:hypothetical protein